jgi:hypothetical protein
MKKISSYLCFVAVFAMLFTSCSKDEEKISGENENATLTFGAALQDFNEAMNNKQQVGACVEGEPAFAQISLVYGPGNTSIDGLVVPILTDGNGYFTDYSDDLEIPIPSGETHVSVTLTDFVVWTDDGEGAPGDVLWVAPKVGGEYAAFVTNPLGGEASTWNLRAGTKRYLDVEVLCFNDREANRYGYQFFDITPTEMMKFCLFGNFCPPSGRHYTASYTVNVWEYADGVKGEQLYFDEAADVINQNGEFYAEPLCFFLPDRDGQDTYWFEVTLRDTEQYDGPDRVILQGPITDGEIRTFYDGANALDYYHFQYGCEEGTPPPFFDPEDDAEHYSACVKALDDGDVLGYAYFTQEGNSLRSTVWTVLNEPNAALPQMIHENASCGSYGGVFWSLDLPGGGWEMSDEIGWLNYDRTFSLTSTEVASLNLEDRTYVLHDSEGTPVGCGEIDQID